MKVSRQTKKHCWRQSWATLSSILICNFDRSIWRHELQLSTFGKIHIEPVWNATSSTNLNSMTSAQNCRPVVIIFSIKMAWLVYFAIAGCEDMHTCHVKQPAQGFVRVWWMVNFVSVALQLKWAANSTIQCWDHTWQWARGLDGTWKRGLICGWAYQEPSNWACGIAELHSAEMG